MSPIGPMPALAPAMLYGLGALAALSGRGWSSAVAHLFAVGGGLAGVAVAVSVLLGGTTLEARLYAAAPFAGFSIRLDPLAAFFLLLISLLAVAASLYAVGYLAGERVGPLAAAYNGFLAAMSLVTLADSVFAFLFAWEAMSLLSYFLVMRNHYDAETRRAGFIYLVMTHIGTAFLAVAFFTLSSGAGSLEFAAFRSAAPHLPPLLRDLIFLSALVGFGAKAGLIPLHVWLPRAHPAAPSHVSALMSGAMIKTAVYGLLRVSWEFAGPGPAWWGELLLALGAVSAVMGVLYALMERDLKRLLAFSSIENMGIIQLGLGAALLLMARGQAAPAALALTAALFHSLNHAAFKGLLFLAAGAVQHRAHTRDLDRLGGLVRRMPWTAGAFLLGAAAIAALPPLNGFASEWLTFQSLLALGATAAGPLEALSAALAAGALALTGGVAALTFVKAFGVGFLGVARSDNAARATEAAGAMRGGMLLLALLCLVLGLAPTAALRLTLPVTTALTGSMVTPSLGLAMLPHPQSGAYAP
ncbi:MAG: proton-conducting transporter membrane subunit, partial [Chloroflexi bacterium]|nr:proton-conducting transporter membrane subunit [Chloroflexota bacterium]